MSKNNLSIIIVNYNAQKLLKNCIESIYSETHEITFDIWVVDNKSSDDSVAMVKEKFPEINGRDLFSTNKNWVVTFFI